MDVSQATSSPTVLLPVRCREITESDLGGLVHLLTKGFSRFHVRAAFWARAFERLSERVVLKGFPRYGYLLESDGAAVGVLLLIFESVVVDGETRTRCNVSSWCVDPVFAGYAGMLVLRALRRKDVTYIDITPVPHTRPIQEALGYAKYCSGLFVSVPALSAWSRGSHVKAIAPDKPPDDGLSSSETELLLAHARYGCISLSCGSRGRRYPFVFAPRRRYGIIPFAYLIYCRDVEDFVRLAGPVGRFLAYRGLSLVVLDANGPVRGLIGVYSDGHPKYFKGPHRPRLGDWAYSERVILGV